jgi:hypothetical protein
MKITGITTYGSGGVHPKPQAPARQPQKANPGTIVAVLWAIPAIFAVWRETINPMAPYSTEPVATLPAGGIARVIVEKRPRPPHPHAHPIHRCHET